MYSNRGMKPRNRVFTPSGTISTVRITRRPSSRASAFRFAGIAALRFGLCFSDGQPGFWKTQIFGKGLLENERPTACGLNFFERCCVVGYITLRIKPCTREKVNFQIQRHDCGSPGSSSKDKAGSVIMHRQEKVMEQHSVPDSPWWRPAFMKCSTTARIAQHMKW